MTDKTTISGQTAGQVRLAVIGAGHLGKIHAKLANQLKGASLAAIIEPHLEGGREVAANWNAAHAATWQEIASEFDAAIVAAPTSLHHNIGADLLKAGKHVLMEKPICSRTDEAAKLVSLAKSKGRTLQVGHVERFNPAFAACADITEPRHLEAVRQGRYTGRSVDVGVVLDLMIHDLDLVLSTVDSPLQRISAIGATVVGPHEDMAQAWLEFANGAVAHLTASRVSASPQRTLTVTGPFARVEMDLGNRSATICRPSLPLIARQARGTKPDPEFSADVQSKHLPIRPLEVVQDANPIRDEQQDFVDAIRTGGTPRVTGEDGLRALAIAQEIVDCIQRREQLETRRLGTVRKAA